MAELVFVTGNAGKLREVNAVLGRTVQNLTNRKIDLPELQGDPRDISRAKGILAAKEIKGPCLVEDTSLCFNAYNGLPGAYIKWFLEKMGHEGLNKMLAGFEDKTAYAQCIFCFCRPNHEPMLFTGRCPGEIVPARGPANFGWDPIFQPDGFDLTFAEMTTTQKTAISHRTKALEQLQKYFAEHPEVLQEEASASQQV